MGPRGNQGPIGPVGPQGIPGGGGTFSVVSTSGGVLSPPAYTILGTEDVVLVDTTSNTVVIYLLPANSSSVTRIVNIKDAKGNAATNNISIVPSGSDTIETVNAPFVISTNFENLAFVSNGTDGYSIL